VAKGVLRGFEQRSTLNAVRGGEGSLDSPQLVNPLHNASH